MNYARAIRAIEKEKAAYERLQFYQVKSKLNYQKIIRELEEAISLLRSSRRREEYPHGAIRKIPQDRQASVRYGSRNR